MKSSSVAMVIILMGVTGSGKTTIGRMLAEELGWAFFDADDFHSPANIQKMKHGIPLTDADRAPWLDRLKQLIRDKLSEGQPAVIACSALKESYRRSLLLDEQVKLVYLRGDQKLIERRLRERLGHFMNPNLVVSQFETLEEPEDSLRVDISLPADEIVKLIWTNLHL